MSSFKVLSLRKRPYYAGYSHPAKRARLASNSTAKFRAFNKRYSSGPKRSGSLAQQVKSLQRVVKDLVPELKNATIDLGQTNITSAGTVTHLSAIAQGVTESTRVSEDIVVKSIAIRGRLINMDTTGTTSAPHYYRFALVMDKQQVVDTSPSNSSIFESSDPVFCLPSIAQSERFSILWVSPLVQNNMVITGNQMAVATHNWNGSIRVGYNGTASTDIQKNGLYFCILTTETANVVDFFGSARVVYQDA